MAAKPPPRPPISWWEDRAAAAGLKRAGAQLEGPCPSCGGTDRFHVRLSDAVFGCRRECEYKAIVTAAGWEPPREQRSRRPALGPPDHEWEYSTDSGRRFKVGRWERTADRDKVVKPRVRTMKGLGRPRPLECYLRKGLRPVVVVEGELTASAAHRAGFSATTWQGGSNKPHLTDWSQLTDCEVVLWPDADDAGRHAMERIAAILSAQGCAVRVVSTDGFSDGDDAADFSDDLIRTVIAETVQSAVWEQRDPLPSHVTLSLTASGLLRCLTHVGADIRYNIRSDRSERSVAGGEWQALSDRADDRLHQDIAENCFLAKPDKRGDPDLERMTPAVFSQCGWTRALGALMHTREVDPYRLWLESLPPPADAPAILETWLTDLFPCLDAASWNVRFASRYLALGIVQRTFLPGCELQEIPVFIGAQRVGKSTMLLELLPPQFQREGFNDSVTFRTLTDAKLTAEALEGVIVAEIAEMAGLSKAEINAIRAAITRTHDNGVRKAYRRGKEDQPRRSIFVGSANENESLPDDPAGNRRYVVVPIPERAAEPPAEFFARRRDAIFAAAVAEFRRGGRANLRPEHYERQEAANIAHAQTDDLLQSLAQRYVRNSRGVLLAGVTMAEIMQWDGWMLRGDPTMAWQRRLGFELRKNGCVKRQTRIDGRVTKIWQLADGAEPPPLKPVSETMNPEHWI